MLGEILTQIKAALYERVASPLSATFAIAWALVNHKYLLLIVASAHPAEKLQLLSNFYSGEQMWWVYSSIHPWTPAIDKLFCWFLLPAFLTWIYIFKLPTIARRFFEKHIVEQKLLLDRKQQLEGLQLLTLEQSQELRVRHKSLETQYQEQIQDLEAQVANLKTHNDAAENRLLEVKRALAQQGSVEITDTPLPLKMSISPNLSPTNSLELSSSANLGWLEVATLDLLGTLANEGAREADIERIFSAAPEGTNRLQLTVALENLIQAKLVARDDSRYALTSMGQRAALKSLTPVQG